MPEARRGLLRNGIGERDDAFVAIHHEEVVFGDANPNALREYAEVMNVSIVCCFRRPA